MQRRRFLCLSAATPLLGIGTLPAIASAGSLPASDGLRGYDVVTTVDLGERTGLGRVWVPLPAQQLVDSSGAYQRLVDTRFDAPGARQAKVVAGHAGARMLMVEWTDPDAPQQLTLTNRVMLRDRAVDLGANPKAGTATAEQLRPWLRASEYKPLDGIVADTSRKIVRDADAKTDVEKARAIYDWIVANCHREGSVRGCGTGDVKVLLTSGNFGGKCADLNGLFVALARASGVPARDVYGVRVDDSAHGYASLGKSGDITRAQHCRAEFYAQGYGWVPVDPADVRKVMLEEVKGGLPATDARVRAANAMLFGAWEMNWLGYNSAEDVRLPGSSQTMPVAFLMYPNGETAKGRLDSLDPATFRYGIQSRRAA
ncbi:transglutaminase-like domain-containing protein [Variovorax sp. Sphag1AA]|uniref:transglutaminase-like domain-containing protein n=1 Tax=Variovorax sp. Sphag1AA TaxID=2587027 RepID=UPI001609A7CD|nr:transglutaminase-like domain-containing protein [Variovorax sp. Sphag1AA]MBB3181377.1 transglutaminase-like putative cysteine protease [Variovorax sp. Sphag1AA]